MNANNKPLTNAELASLGSKREEVRLHTNSMPQQKVDISVFWKNKAEKEEVRAAQLHFKNSGGLQSWNERHRPGNNRN